MTVPFFMLGWNMYRFDKKRAGALYAKLVLFASRGISGSRSAFRCVRGVKC
jgi:hypothetical protein